jgi:hypothetical protein
LNAAEQINLVPTLALLLGVPIPRNSLGSLIPELTGSWSHLEQLRALKINAVQMRQVLKIASSLWIDENTPVPDVAEYLHLYGALKAFSTQPFRSHLTRILTIHFRPFSQT